MSKRIFNISLKGFVGGWKFNADKVDDILSKMAGQEVSVLIDSTGGSIAEAISISAAFKVHGNVSVHYVGMNASAATVASMGAKHISIDRNAMYLVHKSSYPIFEWGSLNADVMQQKIEEYQSIKADLDKIDLNMAAMYASRCRRPVADLLNLMKEGAWLNAREAKDWGFVDEITSFEEDKPARLHEVEARALASIGQPLPNVPVYPDKAEGFFNRLESMFSKFFGNFNNSLSNSMSKVYKFICEILQIDSVEFVDDVAQLSEEQVDKIENHIVELHDMIGKCDSTEKEKDEEIESLKKEIQNLKKAPAASSKAVVEPQKKTPAQDSVSPEENFLKVNASASKLFNSLP